jgi:SAM-dependent methyltransferase
VNEDSDYYQNTRPEMAPFLPPGATRVLEIGCGTGNFRGNFAGPVEYWGVEPEPSAGTIAAGALDRVLVGTFRGVHRSLPDGYFDLIVCNDVIEHMEDHDWFLEAIQTKMRPERACLVGSVPNVRYITNLFALLMRKDWVYADAGILDRTHLRFFTRKSLERSLLSHGFTVERLAGINGIAIRALPLHYLALSALTHAAGWILGRDTLFAQLAFRVSRSV